MKKPKFKKKTVDRAKGVSPIVLDWPDELWSEDVPKYRLVLERINL